MKQSIKTLSHKWFTQFQIIYSNKLQPPSAKHRQQVAPRKLLAPMSAMSQSRTKKSQTNSPGRGTGNQGSTNALPERNIFLHSYMVSLSLLLMAPWRCLATEKMEKSSPKFPKQNVPTLEQLPKHEAAYMCKNPKWQLPVKHCHYRSKETKT